MISNNDQSERDQCKQGYGYFDRPVHHRCCDPTRLFKAQGTHYYFIEKIDVMIATEQACHHE